MKNIKEQVAKVMSHNLHRLKSEDFPSIVIYETLLLQGIEHNIAKLLTDNYKLMDTINRRRRDHQEKHPILRDVQWQKRKKISQEFKQNLEKE